MHKYIQGYPVSTNANISGNRSRAVSDVSNESIQECKGRDKECGRWAEWWLPNYASSVPRVCSGMYIRMSDRQSAVRMHGKRASMRVFYCRATVKLDTRLATTRQTFTDKYWRCVEWAYFLEICLFFLFKHGRSACVHAVSSISVKALAIGAGAVRRTYLVTHSGSPSHRWGRFS